MNWKLIFTLSSFGVFVGLASLFGLTKNIEPILWLGIFIFYAVWIVRYATGRYFLHGFLVSFLNGIWISFIHSIFFTQYIQNNPEMLSDYDRLPPVASPEIMMLIIGPVIGAVTGIVAGTFALIAGKWFGEKIRREKIGAGDQKQQ